MGTVPAARRTGTTAALLGHLLDEAKLRGDRAMVLEVFEQNEPALRLYRRHGFLEICRLYAWRRPAGPVPRADALPEIEEIPTLTALQDPVPDDFPAIPWQISRYGLARLPGARAFRHGSERLVISDPAASPVQIRGVLSTDTSGPAQRQDLLAAVIQRFPEREFFMPAIFPEGMGEELCRPLGFGREELNQFFMRHEF